MSKKLTLIHLYPDLLNLYGDSGNTITLQKRMQWRGYELDVKSVKYHEEISFDDVDIILLGGGSDRDEITACNALTEYTEKIKEYIENNGVFLGFCGGFHMLGKYFYAKEEKINALGIIDIYTGKSDKRVIGNCVIESNFTGEHTMVAGFENHGAKTHIGDYQPFGRVIKGTGNSSTACEGLVYKNLLCTHMHGPLLPKNPKIADEILIRALKRKYPEEEISLFPIDDTAENSALNHALNL